MNPVPFWQQAQIYITLMFMVPIYYVVYKVIGDDSMRFSDTVKVMVITAIISTAIGAILGFWMGQSARQTAQNTPPSDPLAGVIPAGTPSDPVATKEVK